MEENNVLIEALKIVLPILIVYMLGYFIKGKNKKIVGFFGALVSCIEMCVSSLIPIILILIINEKSAEMDQIMMIVFRVIIFISSVPFLGAIIQSIDKDFDMPFGFKSNMISVLLYLAISVILISVFIAGIFGFVTGNLSIVALFATTYMSIGGSAVLIFSICKRFLEKDMKKLEEKLGWIMIFSTFILFIIIMISEI